MANINKLFNWTNNFIKFVGNYDSIILEHKRKWAEEEPKPEQTKAKTKRKKSSLELHEKIKMMKEIQMSK